MSTLLDVTTTSPNDWNYVSEGGSSIVFSYTGTSHLEFEGTALRLRKTTIESLAQALPEGQQVEDPDDLTIAFQHEVIERVLPEEYLPRLEAVSVGREWLEELHRLTEEKRPVERRGKDVIDIRKRKAVIATDLVGGKGYAVEIKASIAA
jgi:inositol-pentakisphosphate 2-kinase